MLWTLINFQTDYNKSILKRTAGLLLIIILMVSLSSCSSSNDIIMDKEKIESLLLIKKTMESL